MGAVAFPYTRVSSKHGFAKPYIFGVLRNQGQSTPPTNFLVDTGSDTCVFDLLFVQQLLHFDPTKLGRETEIQSMERSQPAWIAPADLHIRDLQRSFTIDQALYTRLRGIAGVLGHRGFLDQLSVRFCQGKYFEIEENP